jgi:hypothetical protein
LTVVATADLFAEVGYMVYGESGKQVDDALSLAHVAPDADAFGCAKPSVKSSDSCRAN